MPLIKGINNIKALHIKIHFVSEGKETCFSSLAHVLFNSAQSSLHSQEERSYKETNDLSILSPLQGLLKIAY